MAKRRAFGRIYLKVGKGIKFYGDNIQMALRDVAAIPRSLRIKVQNTVEANAEKMKEMLRQEILKVGAQKPISKLGSAVRTYLDTIGYPAKDLIYGLVHTGKMLEEGVISNINTNKIPSRWHVGIGMSKVNRSHVGTSFEGMSYFEVAKMVQKEHTKTVTPKMSVFFGAVGIPIKIGTKLYHPAREFMSGFQKVATNFIKNKIGPESAKMLTIGNIR